MCLFPFKKFTTLLAVLILTGVFFVVPRSFALQGGQSVNASDYPGLVILSYDSIPDTFVNNHNCSGIVLEPKRILTTTHCVTTLRSNPLGTISIPANKIHVHPVPNGEIGGNFLFPAVTPANTPNVGVSSYIVHPQNSYSGGPYSLAILRLASTINLPAASLYDGNRNFIGQTTTALGWLGERRDFSNYYVLNKLAFPVVDGNTNIDGLCYDNFTYTGTVFCGGFRNSVKFMEFGQDEGMPAYTTINSKNTAIGLLTDASHGQSYQGVFQYEKYARISSMVNFIKQHAPNTQFWNETSGQPEPHTPSIIPILQLLLLNE